MSMTRCPMSHRLATLRFSLLASCLGCFAYRTKSVRLHQDDVVDGILDIFEETLKKTPSKDLWRCEVEACKEVDGALTWVCTSAAHGYERLVGMSSSSCSKKGDSRTVGRQSVARLAQKFVDKKLPVEFVLPAFPYKSRNHIAKTSGELPDMGEALAIAALGHFGERVKQVYEPGAHVTIVSDGHVFNDVAGVSDCALDAYTETIRKFIAHYGKGNVAWAGLDTFVTQDDLEKVRAETGDASPAVLRRRTLENFLFPSDWDVEARIKEDKDYEMMYIGFSIFKQLDFGDMSREHPTKNPGGGRFAGFSRKKQSKFLGTIAKKQMLRNQAYNRMLEARLACGPKKDMECVRLSIHPHPNDVKIGVNLIVGTSSEGEQILDWPTPWHNIVVMDAAFKTQTDEAGFPRVVDADGLPVPLKALTHRWTAEHDQSKSVVALPAVAPRGYEEEVASRAYESVSGPAVGVDSAPWTEKAALCDSKDSEMPFWVCVSRMHDYSGEAQYVTKCGATAGAGQAAPISRPFFFQ
eukprot:TRINITY_DN47558_c0_g1_i1.p1 TRINITY_DN47558_c0_g1~~TRINITY_DN47558_c0_g1_i1.p1  ORF type:complete len:537 (+),score=89.92 TRINITY_DN47558_c0_g1_i1:45-1613(+)